MFEILDWNLKKPKIFTFSTDYSGKVVGFFNEMRPKLSSGI